MQPRYVGRGSTPITRKRIGAGTNGTLAARLNGTTSPGREDRPGPVLTLAPAA